MYREGVMDIRKDAVPKLDPVAIDSILHKTEDLPWLKNLIREYVELINFCESDIEMELINELLNNFTILDLNALSRCLLSIKDILIRDYLINAKDTIFYAFSDDKKSDGSLFVLQAFKNKFNSYEGWEENNFTNSLLEINDHPKRFKKIFLIDDFIGTGNTTVSKYLYAKRKLESLAIDYQKLVVISIAGMGFSKKIVEDEGIIVICPNWLKKGISEGILPGKINAYKNAMLTLEARLDKRKGKHYFPFGYGECEALFSIETVNIPDNVFPIFWWPYKIDGYRNTMFKGLR
jgi:hypothetical protein